MYRIKKAWKKKQVFFWAVVIGLLVILGIMLARWQDSGMGKDKETDKETESRNTPQGDGGEEKEFIRFPYELEDGKLKITSLFTSSVPNPDCDFEEGTDIASVELQNQSDEYLKSADITLTMEDGVRVVFQISDIPAGGKVWAFDKQNTDIAPDGRCVDVQCKAVFEDGGTQWQQQFQTETENMMTVKVTNLTGHEQKKLKVLVHCLMEDTYFGGSSYEYEIETLPADGSVTVEAADCYLGDAAVVLVRP